MMTEDIMLLIARERMDDAIRSADLHRALRRAHPPRRRIRIALGMALVRLGRRLLGPLDGSSSAIEPGRAQC